MYMSQEHDVLHQGRILVLMGEYLEDTQKIGNLNGLACLSSIFLEALDEKAGRPMPMPKTSDKQEKREAKADDRIHISKDNLSTRKLLQ